MKIIKKIFDIYKKAFWTYTKQARNAGVTIGELNFVSSHFWSSEPYLIKTLSDNIRGENLYTWRCWSSSQMVSPI